MRKTQILSCVFLSLVLVCLLGPMLAGPAIGRGQGTSAADQPPSGIEKIDHVIWIIQENRTFDNYFGTFPGADGIPPGTCLPVSPGSNQCVAPFHMPEGMPYWDLAHEWEPAHVAFNNGRMDGFIWAEGSVYTMGYLDERDIPNYWSYARHFVLCDQFFSSLTGPSLRNHVYTVAAQSGGLIDNVDAGGDKGVRAVEEAMDDPDGFSFAALILFQHRGLCSSAPWAIRKRRALLLGGAGPGGLEHELV